MTAEPDGAARVRAALEQRLAGLRAEYETGQAKLAELERQEAFLRERLLMLRGAVQALDDLHAELGAPGSGSPPGGGPA
jgi:predicted nuclease with TOPRIM domain